MNAIAGPSSPGSSAESLRCTSQSSARVDRRLAAVAQHVLRHRPVRHLQPGLVERGEQEAGVAIAEIGLAARRIGQVGEPPPRRSGSIHSRRARTTPRRPIGSAITSRSAASRAASGPAKWPSLRKHCGWIASSQSPRARRSPSTRAAASRFKRAARRDHAIFIVTGPSPICKPRRLPHRAAAMSNSTTFFSAASAAAACCPCLDRARPRRRASPAPTARSTPAAWRPSSIISARSASPCSRRTAAGSPRA